jgi:hypothetical protein
MAFARRTKGIIGIIFGIVALLAVAQWVNWFVYPFTSAKPNFADVETTFNKLQIPKEWKLIETSQNKGLAGRQCPIEGDTCFYTQKVYELPAGVAKEDIQKVVMSSGCVSTTTKDESQAGLSTKYYYECMSGGLRIGGSWELKSTTNGRLTVWSR